jgi:hypothetical protein
MGGGQVKARKGNNGSKGRGRGRASPTLTRFDETRDRDTRERVSGFPPITDRSSKSPPGPVREPVRTCIGEEKRGISVDQEGTDEEVLHSPLPLSFQDPPPPALLKAPTWLLLLL